MKIEPIYQFPHFSKKQSSSPIYLMRNTQSFKTSNEPTQISYLFYIWLTHKNFNLYKNNLSATTVRNKKLPLIPKLQNT